MYRALRNRDILHHNNAYLEDKVLLLKKILEQEQSSASLYTILESLEENELGYFIQCLEPKYRSILIPSLKTLLTPKILLFVSDDLRHYLVDVLSDQEIAALLAGHAIKDVFDLLLSLDEERRDLVLMLMSPKEQEKIQTRCAYPIHSAGRIMQEDIYLVQENWDVAKTLQMLLSHKRICAYSMLFVVDTDNKLVGHIALNSVLSHPQDAEICDIMHKNKHVVNVTCHVEEIAFFFRLYNLDCIPVTNHTHHMMGVIALENIIDIIEDKIEDLVYVGHIHFSDLHSSVFRTSINRLHWLFVTLINTLLTSLVIDQFQDILHRKITLTILMPIAAAMGGNAGIQAATVVIRALATKELFFSKLFHTVVKETKVSLMNGIIFSMLLGVLSFSWFQDAVLTLVLSIAVVFNMLWSGLSGTLFPIIIARMGYDPALSTGPLLTTTTDVIGYAVFLGCADLLLR